jgi:germination protein M
VNPQEREAFREYVVEHASELRRSAYQLSGNRTDADDLLQTALAKAYLAWGRIQERESVDAYVQRVLEETHKGSRRRGRHTGAVRADGDLVAGAESRAQTIQRRRTAIAAATAAGAAVAIALVVPQMRAGDGTPAQVVTPAPSTPAGPVTTPAQTTAAPAASPSQVGTAVAVYYLHDTGTRLALSREFRRTSSPDRIKAAIELMIAGPVDRDYTTLWPAETTVRSVSVRGEVAAVDLNAAAMSGRGGSAAACLSLQELVWTVTGTDNSIKRVALTIEGRSKDVISTWWGVGCGPDEPMSRQTPSYEVLAPVQISSHNDGDTIRGSRFTFGGEATVFEATVSWSVLDATGKSLLAGFDTATEGAPGRGSWQANVVLPGAKVGQRIELRAWETSAKDGSVVNLDTKTVTIGR